MRLYVVFGENTDRLSEHLSARYDIIGTDRTVEAAAAAPADHPEVFLILGTALASTLVNGRVNWGAALVKNLTDLRRACPKSRVVVVLPRATDEMLVREITNLGIYDVHRVDRVGVEKLKEFIDNPRTFADGGFTGDSDVAPGPKPKDVEFGEEEEQKSALESFDWRKALKKLPRLAPRTPKRRRELKAPSPGRKPVVITVTSPWIEGCGVTRLALEAARHFLDQGHMVGLIDADTRKPGISRRLKIPDEHMWEYDWRTGGIGAGIQSGNLLVWALDPLRPGAGADLDEFRRLTEAASEMADCLVVDGGSNPDTGLVAGHALVLVTPAPDLGETIRAWNYFRPVSQGSLILAGECDTKGFGLPVAGRLDEWPDLLDTFGRLERRENHA